MISTRLIELNRGHCQFLQEVSLSNWLYHFSCKLDTNNYNYHKIVSSIENIQLFVCHASALSLHFFFPMFVFQLFIIWLLKTSCCIEAILKFLKKDFDVTISDDAGHFVCNYVYYHSLRFAEQKGHKSLFVHVPLFSRIDEETQMHFVASLLEAIASTCYWYECLFEHFLFVCHLLVHVNHLC